MRTTGGVDCTVALFDLDGTGEKAQASTRYASLTAFPRCATRQRLPPAVRALSLVSAAAGSFLGRPCEEVHLCTDLQSTFHS